jgi:hypothetical protein
MFFLTFFPLVSYFLWLVLLQNRHKPSVFSGSQDFLFLSCGLFGLFTLGPGRLIIPITILSFWGWSVWVFWIIFYFSAVYLISQRIPQRIIIYNCSFTVFVSLLMQHLQKIDPNAHFEGDVLFSPKLNIQCAITENTLGYALTLISTKNTQDRLNWKNFKQVVITTCSLIQNPSSIKLVFTAFFFFSLWLLSIAGFAYCALS